MTSSTYYRPIRFDEVRPCDFSDDGYFKLGNLYNPDLPKGKKVVQCLLSERGALKSVVESDFSYRLFVGFHVARVEYRGQGKPDIAIWRIVGFYRDSGASRQSEACMLLMDVPRTAWKNGEFQESIRCMLSAIGLSEHGTPIG